MSVFVKRIRPPTAWFNTISSDQIASQLIELIRRQAANNRPALLSYLGSQLAKHFGRPFREISPENNLAEFVRKHLAEEVALTAYRDNPLILQAQLREIPKIGAIRTEISEQPPEHSEEKALTDTAEVLRFDPSFWAAFSIPISPKMRRYLRTERPFRFINLSEADQPPEESVLIDREFIAPAEWSKGPDRSDFVFKQIHAWLERNSFPADKFIRLQRERSVQTKIYDTNPVPTIIRILVDLEKHDLERMVIPADVWLKLMKY